MKITISNIAWDPIENEAAVQIIKSFGLNSIEIAPTKLWSKPEQATLEDIQQTKSWWNQQGLEIVSAQSLLYGHPELEIFGSAENRAQTFEYMSKIIRACGQLGAKALVFGSPKNRLVRDLAKTQATEIATEFFHGLAEVAQAAETCLCIEPNPPQYGCDFVRTGIEGVELVKEVDHPGFRLHLDAAAMTLNGEDYAHTIEDSFPWLQHFHASEPFLGLVGAGETQHDKIAPVLRSLGYQGWVSIEMKNGLVNPNTQAVKQAIETVTQIYG